MTLAFPPSIAVFIARKSKKMLRQAEPPFISIPLLNCLGSFLPHFGHTKQRIFKSDLGIVICQIWEETKARTGLWEKMRESYIHRRKWRAERILATQYINDINSLLMQSKPPYIHYMVYGVA